VSVCECVCVCVMCLSNYGICQLLASLALSRQSLHVNFVYKEKYDAVGLTQDSMQKTISRASIISTDQRFRSMET